MLSGISEFVIQGITEDGALFDQTGWAANLCNMHGSAGSDGRMIYSSFVRPLMVNGVPAVVVQNELQHVDPKAFEMIKQFVAEHQLKVRSGRGSRDAEATGVHPVIGQERRKPEPKGW